MLTLVCRRRRLQHATGAFWVASPRNLRCGAGSDPMHWFQCQLTGLCIPAGAETASLSANHTAGQGCMKQQRHSRQAIGGIHSPQKDTHQ